MSIQSRARRAQKKKREKIMSLRTKIRWFGALTRRCNYPGCGKRSYRWKRCNEHRLRASLSSTLAKLAKEGEIDRVGKGVYRANDKTGKRKSNRGGWWQRNREMEEISERKQ